MLASVVIRTLNEERHLDELLHAVKRQKLESMSVEVVVVDSGSTDKTLDIARAHDCKLVGITRDEFTFGRALNVGCKAAQGDVLVMVSGHCIPVDDLWLDRLVRPLVDRTAAYSYGRQVGNDKSRFSERQLFKKYFPAVSQLPQEGFFCNNANSALLRTAWEHFRFDEELTGLEDMELAARLVRAGQKIAYVADAPVYHLHEESWSKIKRRYEREAIALQRIMPQVHISFVDFLRYFASAVLLDSGEALQQKAFFRALPEIVAFRLMQFWGSYRGNNEHRKLSRVMKEKYFYPR
jgi:glycosyltransferase involved in cell wall biosynthesis